MLSEGEEVVRVIRAAFTPYVRALGREFPAHGSARFAKSGAICGGTRRGDVYVALDGERIRAVSRNRRRKPDREIAVDAKRAPGSGAGCCGGSARCARRAALKDVAHDAEMAVANIRLYSADGLENVSRGPPDHG